MIIDLILDRKDGDGYDVEDFYRDCVEYGEVGFEITRALDSGTEEDVKQALCDYIIENDYNKNICKYINSVNWLDDSIVESKKSTTKSLKEGIQKKDWKDWEIDAFELGTYFFNGNKVNERDVQNLINEDYDNISVNYIEINKLLDKMFVGKTLGDLVNQEYAMIFGKNVDLALWFDLTLEKLKTVQNGKYGFVTIHATFSIPSTHEIYNFGLGGYIGVNIGYGSMFLESKKFVRKSLKEGINDELIATSFDGETTLYLSDERQANHGKDPHYEFKLGENGYFTRYIRCDDNRCENVVLNWIKEFDFDISKSEISKIIKLHESKKSARKSLKEENNRQKVTEGIMRYFDGLFPLIEKDDTFRFSMYTKKNVVIGIEVFKDYIFVGLFNLDGKNNLDEYTEIPREVDSLENEILYDSDAIFGYLEEYKLV